MRDHNIYNLYLPLAAVAVEGAPVVAGVGAVGGPDETLFLVELQASTVTTTSGSSNNTRGESIVGTAENCWIEALKSEGGKI